MPLHREHPRSSKHQRAGRIASQQHNPNTAHTSRHTLKTTIRPPNTRTSLPDTPGRVNIHPSSQKRQRMALGNFPRRAHDKPPPSHAWGLSHPHTQLMGENRPPSLPKTREKRRRERRRRGNEQRIRAPHPRSPDTHTASWRSDKNCTFSLRAPAKAHSGEERSISSIDGGNSECKPFKN